VFLFSLAAAMLRKAVQAEPGVKSGAYVSAHYA